MEIHNLSVTTTAGEKFSGLQHAQLAHQVWLRFGRDDDAAAAGWRRLLENNCPTSDFVRLRSFHDYQEQPLDRFPAATATVLGVELRDLVNKVEAGLRKQWPGARNVIELRIEGVYQVPGKPLVAFGKGTILFRLDDNGSFTTTSFSLNADDTKRKLFVGNKYSQTFEVSGPPRTKGHRPRRQRP